MLLPQDLIGIESDLPEVARAILELARTFDVPVVGGYHVTCSDETEWQCAQAFQRVLVRPTLPALGSAAAAAFHTMNLGARYEPGAVRIAEHHYAIDHEGGRAKVMVVKVNSHVAVAPGADGSTSGMLDRYGVDSTCCGALAAMFTDAALPALDELRETFGADGVDRIAMLRDEARVPAAQRLLLTAVANARLQAARAVDDITGYTPHSPTVWLVVPCVTLNRANGEDTELIVGQYAVDATEEEPAVRYRGLGDVPSEYRLQEIEGRIVIEDPNWPAAP